MIERADLQAAAEAGVIAPDRVEPLLAFLAARGAPQAAVMGEEDLRFIRNFHDVFLAIGIVLLAAGLAGGIASAIEQAPPELSPALILGGCLGAAAILWVLAEFFSRRRRLFLPSIALCVAIAMFVAFVGAWLGQGAQPIVDALRPDHEFRLMGPQAVLPFGLLAAGLAAGAFYARFRLPFALGLSCALLAVLPAFTLALIAPSWTPYLTAPLALLAGAALFALGVWFDVRDPERRTRLSDNGFWLHLAAAPLLLNGALRLVTPGGLLMDHAARSADGEGAPVLSAALTLLIVAVLGFVSVLINRRALIVSALVTTGIAIGMLMAATGLGTGALLAGTLVTLGGFVLVLGASWHGIRRVLLGWVKPQGVWTRIFPPEAAA